MIIYRCRFTGDEMLSDAFRPRPVLDNDGNEVPGLMEIDSSKVNKDSGATIDIGRGNEFGSGEDENDIPDPTAEIVNNVIDETIGFDLHEMPMSKKDLRDFLREYCNQLRLKLKQDPNIPGPQVKAFTQAAPIFCKHLLSLYNDLEFYTSTSMDPEGSMVFGYFKGESLTPSFIYIQAGLLEEKC